MSVMLSCPVNHGLNGNMFMDTKCPYSFLAEEFTTCCKISEHVVHDNHFVTGYSGKKTLTRDNLNLYVFQNVYENARNVKIITMN